MVTRSGAVPVVTLALMGIAGVVTLFTSKDLADVVGPVAVMAGHGVGGYLFLSKARMFHGRERAAWTLVGSGLAVASAGVLVVAILSVVRGSVPAFGPTDLIFLGTYALILVGFGSLPHAGGSLTYRIRLALDGLIGAVALASILWVLVLGDLFHDVGVSPMWERTVASTYPILDVAALIVVMTVVIRRSSLRFDLRLILFGLGLALQSAADMTYFATGVGKTFDEASPSYVLYLAAVGLWIVAGMNLHRVPEPREYADRRTPLWAMVAPYGAAAVLVIVLVQHLRKPTLAGEDYALLIATLLVGLMVIARQAVAIRENRQLVERQRAALVSSISHELRTPLTAMVGFLDLLSSGGEAIDGDEKEELIGIVHQQATYMARIVEDLILLARKDPGDMVLSESQIRVRDVVCHADNAVDAGGTTRIEVPGTLWVRGDADRLEQALVNLLSNAVRYGGKDRLVTAMSRGSDLVLEVHDAGPGVPRKYELVIWERFERGSRRFDATAPGSGIGLAVVEAVARAHGGSAGYRRSELLGGACFFIRLPGRATERDVEEDPADCTTSEVASG